MKQIRASASPVFGSAPFDTSTTNDYMPRRGRAELRDLGATSHQAPQLSAAHTLQGGCG